MTTDTPALMHALTEATRGLLFPSESDFPIEPFRFGREEPTPEALVKLSGLPEGTAVEEGTVGALFEGLTVAAEGATEEEKASAGRFRGLVEVIERELKEVRAVRVGKNEVEAFVLGRDADGEWVGVRTRMTET
jgi:hypothetical protein